MTLNEYQEEAAKTAIYPSGFTEKGAEMSWMYPALLLPSEVGELMSYFQKAFRDKEGSLEDASRDLIVKEMGDILWALSELARRLGVSLEEVGQGNIYKLADRARRGVLRGSGDER